MNFAEEFFVCCRKIDSFDYQINEGKVENFYLGEGAWRKTEMPIWKIGNTNYEVSAILILTVFVLQVLDNRLATIDVMTSMVSKFLNSTI